jgi:hypothetical protein
MAFIDIKLATEPSFVFHHIPKTAGTSFMAVVHNWFHVFSDYEGLYKSRHEFRMHPVDLDLLSASSVLAGHWNTAISTIDLRYPALKGNPRFQFFSFLRDPLEMNISMFNYRWKMDPADCRKHKRYDNLSNYLASTNNVVSKLMGCDPVNFKKVLERYYFIGITERMEDSIVLYKKKTLDMLRIFPDSSMAKRQICIIENKPDIQQQRLNVVSRQQDKDIIPEDELKDFKRRNALDYILYESAIKKLEESLSEAVFP